MANKTKSFLTRMLDSAFERSFARQNGKLYPGHHSQVSNQYDVQEQLFTNKLLDVLDETLDIQKLLTRFTELTRSRLQCDGIEYTNENDNLYFYDGRSGSYQCVFNLSYDGRQYGRLVFSRYYPFTDKNRVKLDTLVAGLMSPLRNAIKYEQTLMQVQYDLLTGLRKGSYYFDTVPQEIARSHRYSVPYSVLLIDIDDFNAINLKYGREVGDRLLIDITGRIKSCIRLSDIPLRYGGDRFLILLPQTDIKEAEVVAGRIRKASRAPFKDEKTSTGFSLSVGVVCIDEKDNSHSLIQRADKALYHAKVLGKNRVHVIDNQKPNPASTINDGDGQDNRIQKSTINPFLDDGGAN